jgi:hypothetical protein
MFLYNEQVCNERSIREEHVGESVSFFFPSHSASQREQREHLVGHLAAGATNFANAFA